MGADLCIDFVSPHSDARVVVYDLAIGLPALAFLAYLAWTGKASLRKLRRSRSHIMGTYYGFVWGVTALNLLRSVVQIAQAGSGPPPVLWNLLWLATRFGMILLEVSVVVFLLQGYRATGQQALVRTLAVAAAVAALDLAVKAVYIFGLHVPLFLFGGTADSPQGDMGLGKWSFWLLHSLAAVALYGAIVALPHTRWRDALPAKPSFYRYVAVLLGVYGAMALGALLIGSKLLPGYCVYGVAAWLYYGGYSPLLYATFLAEFLGDTQLDLDLLLYSEMQDAGFVGGEEFEDLDAGPGPLL